MNSDIWMPDGSVEEAHKRALTWIYDDLARTLVMAVDAIIEAEQETAK